MSISLGIFESALTAFNYGLAAAQKAVENDLLGMNFKSSPIYIVVFLIIQAVITVTLQALAIENIKNEERLNPVIKPYVPWWEVVFFLPLLFFRADIMWQLGIINLLICVACTVSGFSVGFDTDVFDFLIYTSQYTLSTGLYALMYKIQLPNRKLTWYQIVFWPWAMVPSIHISMSDLVQYYYNSDVDLLPFLSKL